jgi:hypothetical protein
MILASFLMHPSSVQHSPPVYCEQQQISSELKLHDNAGLKKHQRMNPSSSWQLSSPPPPQQPPQPPSF